jgi:MFS transporter, SP family, galactose:H+ symporter
LVVFLLALPVPATPLKIEEAQFLTGGYWRIIFAIPIAISVIQILLLLTVFNWETPKYYKERGQTEKLRQVMAKIYHPHAIEARIAEINVSNNVNEKRVDVSFKDSLFNRKFLYATYLGCALSFFQQFSGINAVIFYSSTIFQKVGWQPRTGTAIVGVVNLVACLISLGLLSCFGRRTLLWTVSFMMGAVQIALGIAFYYADSSDAAKILCCVFIFAYIIFFEFSLGPIPWLFVAEIATPKGFSIAVVVNWLCTLAVAIATPYLISGALFIVFGGICVLSGLFSLFLLKETKGLTAAQIQELYSLEKKK